MTEPLVIQSLKDKRAEIHGRIAAYPAQLCDHIAELYKQSGSLRSWFR
jgi:hypothetical protein